MGKQSKRNKSKRGNKQRSNPVVSTVSSTAASSPSAKEEKGVLTIVNKIRHGDPRVRHAALVALSGTLFHSSTLSAAAQNKQEQQRQDGGVGGGGSQAKKSVGAEVSDETLLRALSERILDVDIPCATTATGCLSNYVSFYCAGDADETSAEAEVASEVMVPILMQRIQRSLDKLRSLGAEIESSSANKVSGDTTTITISSSTAAAANTTKTSSLGAAGSNAIDKSIALIIEQWMLVSLSLQTLAGLIENFASVVKRLSVASLSILCAVMPLVDKSIRLIKKSFQENNVDCILDASSNASRAIHSLLDDNIAIIMSIQPTTLTSIVSELSNTISNVQMPHITRLHASGALLSLRKVLVLDEENHSRSTLGGEYDAVVAAVKTCTDSAVIDLLSTLFKQGDTIDPKQLVFQIIELSKKCQSMKQDEMMESQIVSEINARKEPARLIARRQKEMKERKVDKADNEGMVGSEKNAKNGACDMIVEDKEEGEGSNTNEPQLDDLRDELDDVVVSWKELVGSYKLALELVANICSGKEELDDDMEDGMYPDDDKHMWNSDDEAKLLSAANTVGAMNSMDSTYTPSERATFAAMASNHLLELILSFFLKWVEFLPMLNDVPVLVADDVDELQSTCALCLGNMAACDIPSLKETSIKKIIIFGDQEAPVTEGLDFFWWKLIAAVSSEVSEGSKAHITSVMLSLLRHQPKARTLVNSAALDILLVMLTRHGDKEGGANNVQMRCNIISMLGLLCSEPHTSEINGRVCSTLLEKLRSPLSSINDDVNNCEKARQSLVIMHEILNVLMDMYGGDDSHEDVFCQQDVLGHFQRCLPGLRRRIKKAKTNSSREDLDTWNETALNCSRFIKYKNEM